jgi:hypothetical protein
VRHWFKHIIPFLNQSAIFVGSVVGFRYFWGSRRPLHEQSHDPQAGTPASPSTRFAHGLPPANYTRCSEYCLVAREYPAEAGRILSARPSSPSACRLDCPAIPILIHAYNKALSSSKILNYRGSRRPLHEQSYRSLPLNSLCSHLRLSSHREEDRFLLGISGILWMLFLT